MSDEFPEDVRLFIADHINSVAEVEVLLLLKGQPERQWSADEVSKALYTTPEMAATQLAELQGRGLLAAPEGTPPRYQYRPGSEELHRLVSRLEEIYQQRRVSVITQIYSKPVDRVRTFADAFRLRKEK
jgi:hypothetical protein